MPRNPGGQYDGSTGNSGVLWLPQKQEGLARTLAKAGYGSRRTTAEAVRNGRVRVDDQMVYDPATPVGPDSKIELDDAPLVEAPRRFFAFHKPAHVVIRSGDHGGRKVIDDFLPPEIPGLQAAGRLDAKTSGLVLISNDNHWNACASDVRGIDREYRIIVTGEVKDVEIGIITVGLHLQHLGFIRPRKVTVVSRSEGRTELTVLVNSGHNRQVRRVFKSLRHELILLCRTRIGEIALDGLPPGSLRALTPREIALVGHRIRPKGES